MYTATGIFLGTEHVTALNLLQNLNWYITLIRVCNDVILASCFAILLRSRQQVKLHFISWRAAQSNQFFSGLYFSYCVARVTSCTVKQDRSCGCFETTFLSAHKYVTRLHAVLLRRPDGEAARVQDKSFTQHIFATVCYDRTFLVPMLQFKTVINSGNKFFVAL
jgi:hypothetical protein